MRTQTSYRSYTLAKAGLAAAYLWYVWDFFRIHRAIQHGLSSLLHPPATMAFVGIAPMDEALRSWAEALSRPAMTAVFLGAAPVAMGLYAWGRHRWLQAAVGLWASFSLIALSAIAGAFVTTADIWLHFSFLAYALAALVSPGWDEEGAGLSRQAWALNPTLSSTYAWLLVLLQFTVYFYAGVSKLAYGWEPWTTGRALQNLAYDHAMRASVQGLVLPGWIALGLCYVTLAQRLIVPFGFFLGDRGRFWSALCLGSMHLGYALLMHVNSFPLIGIASLLMVWPPSRQAPHAAPVAESRSSLRPLAIYVFSAWLLLEPARLIVSNVAFPGEAKLLLAPVWNMFADGGVNAAGRWRLVLETPQGKLDATGIPLSLLPGTWRDRFYIDHLYRDLLNGTPPPGSSGDLLVTTARRLYAEQATAAHADPTILYSGFDLYDLKR